MIFTWEGFASILPTAAFSVATFALWTDNAQKIRYGWKAMGENKFDKER